jgi:DNA-binding PadR family transcriptional regulator
MAKSEHLGEFEQLALLAVLRLGADAYGATIQEELDRTAGRSSAISSIYITLTRLESKGFVRSSMEAPATGPSGESAAAGRGGARRGGKPRRYFHLEPAGLEALKASRATLINMWDGVEQELETA